MTAVSEDNTNWGIIGGAVGGGVLLIMIIAAVAFFVINKRKEGNGHAVDCFCVHSFRPMFF